MMLHRIDHVCLRVADLREASARWALQFGLVERSRESGKARLAWNDEPYWMELVEGARTRIGTNDSRRSRNGDVESVDERALRPRCEGPDWQRQRHQQCEHATIAHRIHRRD